MTGLLSSSVPRASGVAVDSDPRRPLALGAALAGLVAAGSVLLVCMAVGLAGWFASDAGRYGDTRDALRVGADAWLLAHGASLRLEMAEISVIPLGLTLFCAYVSYRLGAWAAATSAVDGWGTAVTGTTVLAGVYAVVVTLTGIAASLPDAEPGLGRASAGGFLLASVFGGLGVVAGSGQWTSWRSSAPAWTVSVGTGAVSGVLLMTAAGSLLLLVALLLDFGTAANVLSRLHTDVPGGLLYSLVVATLVPNAALLSGAYLLGPGFMVGTGTLVSPAAVVLGPVPAFPLLAALPDPGATPAWTSWLVATPVLLAAVAVALAHRRFPVVRYGSGGLRGLASGALSGVLLGLMTGLAGGSAGPGRMADIGVELGRTVLAAGVAMGAGGLLAGFWMTWWARRRASAEPSAGSTTKTVPADPTAGR